VSVAGPFLAAGVRPAKTGNLGYSKSPTADTFPTARGDLTLGVVRQQQFEALSREVGRPQWLADPRFATREGWAEQRNVLVRPALERWARDKTKSEAARALNEMGIAAGPSHTADDLRRDPHVASHGMLVEVPRPDRAEGSPPMLVSGNPIQLSAMAQGPIARFPMVGEHTDDVLRGELGLADGELEALAAEGIVGRARVPRD